MTLGESAYQSPGCGPGLLGNLRPLKNPPGGGGGGLPPGPPRGGPWGGGGGGLPPGPPRGGPRGGGLRKLLLGLRMMVTFICCGDWDEEELLDDEDAADD